MLLLKMYNPAWRNWNVVYHRAQYWAQCCLPHIFFLSVKFLRKFGVQFHCCADDIQLYIPFSQNDNSCLGSIEECVSEIQIWMKANFLKLNAETRQIWGIWKLRPAYSPETPKLGQNQCFVLCDFEIWRMTLENNRASLLCSFKLCATFHSHWWIQTGLTVRKRPIWVKFDDF